METTGCIFKIPFEVFHKSFSIFFVTSGEKMDQLLIEFHIVMLGD